jgi:hypothetical protein
MNVRFYDDPETEAPHIYKHGIDEEEIIDVLSSPGEDRPGREGSRVVIGRTRAGRYLRMIMFQTRNLRAYLSLQRTSCAENHCLPIEDAYVGKERGETE